MSTPTATGPSLVFIPGAWHRPTCYDTVIAQLKREYGYRCIRVMLPSTQDNRHATFKDDLDAARNAVTDEINTGHDVVVIAHSYGGIIGGSVVKGLIKDKSTTTHHHGVISLVMIATGFPFTGITFMAPFFNRPPPFWRIDDSTGYAVLTADPKQLFYHDVPSKQRDHAVSQLTTQSLLPLFTGGENVYSGWRHLPVWYIGTVQDRGLPVFVQRMLVGVARGMGGHVYHHELNTSHSPFLSQPAEVAVIIHQAATSKSVSYNHDRIIIPRVRLLSPVTWIRWGVPVAFGHVLGWCILAYFTLTHRL